MFPPINTKGIRSFLSHAGFYRRFIMDLSKVTKPMCKLLQHDMPYILSKECEKAFNMLKQALISVPTVKTPKSTKPFELMCNASDFDIGVVLGQRHNKGFHIHWSSNKLHHHWERTTGSCVCIWQVHIILGGHQSDSVY